MGDENWCRFSDSLDCFWYWSKKQLSPVYANYSFDNWKYHFQSNPLLSNFYFTKESKHILDSIESSEITNLSEILGIEITKKQYRKSYDSLIIQAKSYSDLYRNLYCHYNKKFNYQFLKTHFDSLNTICKYERISDFYFRKVLP